jgi:hypothetical protein
MFGFAAIAKLGDFTPVPEPVGEDIDHAIDGGVSLHFVGLGHDRTLHGE